jgi:hypothetical protein
MLASPVGSAGSTQVTITVTGAPGTRIAKHACAGPNETRCVTGVLIKRNIYRAINIMIMSNAQPAEPLPKRSLPTRTIGRSNRANAKAADTRVKTRNSTPGQLQTFQRRMRAAP